MILLTKIKNIYNDQCWWGWRETDTFTLLKGS